MTVRMKESIYFRWNVVRGLWRRLSLEKNLCRKLSAFQTYVGLFQVYQFTLSGGYFLKGVRSPSRVSTVSTDVNCTTSGVYNKHTFTLLIFKVSLTESDLARTFTSMAGVVSPLWMQRCRLASPSVTKRIRACPASVSGTKPARIAAWRICACCEPSHPFECVRMKSIALFRSIVAHKSGSLG